MYKDVISYELAEGITESHLLRIARQIVDDWMKKQDGFIRWEIHQQKSGGYTDIVYWESEEAAKKAEQEMVHIPNAAAWYACYKQGSIQTQNLRMVSQY